MCCIVEGYDFSKDLCFVEALPDVSSPENL